MNRQVFSLAIIECDKLIERYPELGVLTLIKDQVQFLAALHKGEAVDPSRVNDIVLGVLLARQVDHLLSPSAASLFEEITSYAAEKKRELLKPSDQQ